MNYKKFALLACIGGSLVSLDTNAYSVHCPSYEEINKNLTLNSTFVNQDLTWKNTSVTLASGQLPNVSSHSRITMSFNETDKRIICGYFDNKTIVYVSASLPKVDGVIPKSVTVETKNCTALNNNCVARYYYIPGMK